VTHYLHLCNITQGGRSEGHNDTLMAQSISSVDSDYSPVDVRWIWFGKRQFAIIRHHHGYQSE
jgi:hypothetical protein